MRLAAQVAAKGCGANRMILIILDAMTIFSPFGELYGSLSSTTC